MPTRTTAWPEGTPCWIDYGAADIEAAKAFYAGLFGWTYAGGEPEYGGYLNCLLEGKHAAGMGPQQDPDDPPRWTTYFATQDAEATAARIMESGGTVIVPPMDIGPMGRMVIALDPQHNPFGLWEAGEHTGVQIYNQPGSLVWNEAAVEDADSGRAFYAAVFGWHYDEVPDAGGYTTFALEDRPLGGFGSHEEGSPKGWGTCFSVASTDAAVEKVTAAGGSTTMAPLDTPYGRIAVLADPWRAGFAVMQHPPG
jgi:predicted enzyme related to lactoylglutathione lyase